MLWSVASDTWRVSRRFQSGSVLGCKLASRTAQAMIDKPTIHYFLVDMVMDFCVVEHHDGHFCSVTFFGCLIEKANDSKTFDGFLVALVSELICTEIEGAKNWTSAMWLRHDAVWFADWRPASLYGWWSWNTRCIEVDQTAQIITCCLLQFCEDPGFHSELLFVSFFFNEYRPRL